MQQMDSEEVYAEQQGSYKGYAGDAKSDQPSSYAREKLAEEGDELFAEMLIRRIKQELKEEMQPKKTAASAELRFALAAISVLLPIVVLIISIFIPTVNMGLLIWGLIIVCGVSVPINLTFNDGSH